VEEWGSEGGGEEDDMTDFYLNLLCLSSQGVSPDSIDRLVVMGA